MAKHIKTKVLWEDISVSEFFKLLAERSDIIFERDNQGQIVIYTGLSTDEKGYLIEHDPE